MKIKDSNPQSMTAGTQVPPWRDQCHDRPLKEVIDGWKRIVDFNPGPFCQFFVASPESKGRSLLECISAQLEVAPENTFEIDYNTKAYSIKDQLRALGNSIQRVPEQRILIIVSGFEQRFEGADGSTVSRAAHDYNQRLVEDKTLNVLFQAMGKKLIILTRLDSERGQAFRDCLRSAAGSQFKDGMLHIA